MNEVRAISLKIDTFACGIGANQDTQGLDIGVSVEGALDLFTAIRSCRAGKDANAVVGLLCALNGLAQPSLKPAARVFIFREDDETPTVPVPAGQ